MSLTCCLQSEWTPTTGGDRRIRHVMDSLQLQSRLCVSMSQHAEQMGTSRGVSRRELPSVSMELAIN